MLIIITAITRLLVSVLDIVIICIYLLNSYKKRLNDELYSIAFVNAEVEKSLAKANIRCEHICYNGVPMILCVTDGE